MPGLVAVVGMFRRSTAARLRLQLTGSLAANFAFSIVSVLLFGAVLGGGMYLVLGVVGTSAVLPHPSHSLRAPEEEWEWVIEFEAGPVLYVWRETAFRAPWYRIETKAEAEAGRRVREVMLKGRRVREVAEGGGGDGAGVLYL